MMNILAIIFLGIGCFCAGRGYQLNKSYGVEVFNAGKDKDLIPWEIRIERDAESNTARLYKEGVEQAYFINWKI